MKEKTKRKNVQLSARRIQTFPPGYVAPKKTKALPMRLGIKRWLVRAVSDDRAIAVIDAVSAEEAIQRAHLMRFALQCLEVWPKLSLVYAEQYGDGPVSITWFREGLFLAIHDLQQPQK